MLCSFIPYHRKNKCVGYHVNCNVGFMLVHHTRLHIYTFSQTGRKNRNWLHFHSHCSIALIVGLNRNFYYLHLALHKLSVGHVSYSCTLSGRIGKNDVVKNTTQINTKLIVWENICSYN